LAAAAAPRAEPRAAARVGEATEVGAGVAAAAAVKVEVARAAAGSEVAALEWGVMAEAVTAVAE
jgi:hypothetical protein